jgi:hypothetical protein
MTQRSTRLCVTALVLMVAVVCGPWLAGSPKAAAAVKQDITVTPKISDKASGFIR